MAEKKDLYGYDEEDILTLEFDDGDEEECGILGVFDALGKEYIALNPLGTEDVYRGIHVLRTGETGYRCQCSDAG